MHSNKAPVPLVIARALAVAVVLLLISCSLVLFPTIRCIPAIVTTYTKWGLELYFNGSDEGWMTRPKVVVHASTEPTIPRIIHQMWKTTQVPEQWLPVVDSCRRMYPDWQYIMWTDETMHSFVQTHFPSFLDQYEAYPYNIQRADAFRYLVLLEMGGVYIDMDVGCVRRLDPLLHNTVVLPATRPLGFSNEFMMAAPGAPFMARLVRRLPAWATNFGTKYPTVMFSTGPMFVTVQHAVYEHAREEVVMMRDDMYGKFDFNTSTAYLQHFPGSSWHGDDSAIVFWLYAHLSWLVRGGLLALLCTTVVLWMRRRQRSISTLLSSPSAHKSKSCIV